MKLFLNRKGFTPHHFYAKNSAGFTLIEVMVATAVFLLFAIGIYGGVSLVFKIVYSSRLRILETALLSEQLELVRNLPFESVGIVNGVPSGVLPYTTTTVRNGVTFVLITTVRNIDDPFDGTVTSTPADSAPADYKLVEMSIICQNCFQREAVVLSTRVSPSGLEGASQNGSLFIHVFDVNGLDVAGATVNVTNTASTTPIIITDTTDNSGRVQIIDTPTGTQSYHIRVSKTGYSSDYTVSSTASVPNPSKSPSNVVSQMVTDISFQIDRVGTLNLNTVNQNCASVASAPFSVHGEKVVGASPLVYKYSDSIITNASGAYTFSNVEWDKYHFAVTGVTYDIAGSIPMLPIDMTPGLTQNATMIMANKNGNSLLAQVKDAGTGLPLSDATVRLYDSPSYDETKITGVGYLRQTDWSGGSGQANYTNLTKYFADSGTVSINSPAGDLKLKKSGGDYLASGWLESSAFDFGGAVNFNNITFLPASQPVQTGANPLVFQIATANTTSPSQWNYSGPDGATSTYYTVTSTLINDAHNGDRYLRYKVYLNTADEDYTPQLSEVALTYTNSCSPPGQAYFSNLLSATYNIDISRAGYTTKTDTIEVTTTLQTIINLSPS